jgi:hypothetical protein
VCACVCVCARARVRVCVLDVCVSDECWRIGVVICLGRDGRPSGDCFVRFRESVDMEKGLKKDRATMQRRYYSFFLLLPHKYTALQCTACHNNEHTLHCTALHAITT